MTSYLNRISAIGLAALLMIVSGCGGVAPVPPVFLKANYTLASAKAAEKDAKKPLLVMATASWCGPCQALKRGALLDTQLASIIDSKTLPVYLDVDENSDAAIELKVMSVPTLFLIREGRIVSKIGGVQTAEQLSQWLNEAVMQK